MEDILKFHVEVCRIEQGTCMHFFFNLPIFMDLNLSLFFTILHGEVAGNSGNRLVYNKVYKGGQTADCVWLRIDIQHISNDTRAKSDCKLCNL